jgi:dihydrofolate reductase
VRRDRIFSCRVGTPSAALSSSPRRLVYNVAASLDGFIAGPDGEVDWITPDSAIDFRAIYSRFDIFLMGRRTFDVARTRGDLLQNLGMRIVVVSTTLNSAEHPGLTVVSTRVPEAVAALKAEEGKGIWLSGGGVLFRSLLDAGLVDEVSLSVFPILLGAGVPLLPAGHRAPLKLESSKPLPSGVLMLNYSITRGPAPA